MTFGEFVLDLDRGALSCGETELKLRPKSFAVLRYLVEHHGRLVSKEALLQKIWSHMAVTDGVLTQCLMDIRRALGDESQRIIRTIPRRGYRLDMPVTLPESDEKKPSGMLVIGSRRARLVTGENIVGRDPACDVWINNVTVSRRHARIVAGRLSLVLEDLGSKNGTRVGDRLITERHDLRDGDRLRFGKVDAVFRDTPSAQPTETQLDIAD